MAPVRSASVLRLLVVLASCLAPLTVWGDNIGEFKVVRGSVFVERGGERLPVQVGTRVQAPAIIVTGADGSAGITFADNSLLSLGPNSVLVIEQYAFDATTYKGVFESALRKGTLAVVSGRIAAQSPDAMKVKTPVSVLAVRGSEFVVRASDGTQ